MGWLSSISIAHACHRWGDRGQAIGPDLASITDRLPETMLVAILDPNRAVEARYKSYTATTQEGLSYTGIVTLESDTSITLTLADGKQQSLLRSEIEELTTGGKSLMPEGSGERAFGARRRRLVDDAAPARRDAAHATDQFSCPGSAWERAAWQALPADVG